MKSPKNILLFLLYGLLFTVGAPIAYIAFVLSPYAICGPVQAPLPNGYSYSPDSNGHLIRTEHLNQSGSRTVERFYFVNRIDVYREYVVGEVVPWQRDSDEEKFKYFIINTKTGSSTGELSKALYEQRLEALKLARKIKLHDRSHLWRLETCLRYG